MTSLISTLRRRAAAHPYPLLFATISGAHLYGFPSPDSDFDLRGTHLLPLRNVVGMTIKDETVEIASDPATDPDHLEFDIVSHENPPPPDDAATVHKNQISYH